MDPAVVASTAALSGSNGTHQSWVKACLWNPIKRQRGYTVIVLLDTGAGGGNYASLKFIQAAQRHAFNGKRIISKRGRGRLHAANPAKDNVPPMTIVGTAILPLIFPPVDRNFLRTSTCCCRPPFWTYPGGRLLASLQQRPRLRGPGHVQAFGRFPLRSTFAGGATAKCSAMER